MRYTSYRDTRDAVLRLLIDLGADELPIKISAVCKALDIDVRTLE